MPRLLFEKKGDAVWISHLDLMRLFQRAFKRAGLNLTHTQGYNPRPSVSIAMPLSVGVESVCELLDFEVENVGVSCEEIREKLNRALIEGVEVLCVYDHGKKTRELAYLKCQLLLQYDGKVSDGTDKKIRDLFSKEEVLVEKKAKNAVVEQNIIPMIQSVAVQQQNRSIVIETIICCQNPSLNPLQLIAAIEKYLPELAPDFTKCCRAEIYDRNFEVFR